MSEKKWITLNQHGKRCLRDYLYSLSSSDMLTTRLDYLYNKGLVDYCLNFKGRKAEEERIKIGGHLLTDLGIECARHYFPEYSDFKNITSTHLLRTP